MTVTLKKAIRWRFLSIAFIIWTFYVFAHAFCAYINDVDKSFSEQLRGSAVIHYCLALMSVGIWFLCKRMPYGKFFLGIFILIHVLSACVITITWNIFIFGTAYLAMGDGIYDAIDNFPRVIVWQLLFGIKFYTIITAAYYTIIYYQNFREKELAETELKLLSRDAELRALKLQLNPHFLFNSLNSINALVTKNPKLARRMIASLSDVLRMALASHDMQMVPLQYELDFTDAYLEIELIRFGDKMDYRQQVDPSLLTRSVPSMMLQPLLENAVKHGIANRLDGGTVRLTIKSSAQNMIVEVSNQLDENRFVDSKALFTNGTGLRNLKERLDRLYGERYQFDVDMAYGGKFAVRVTLPNMSETSEHAN